MAFSKPLGLGYEERIGDYDIDTREKSELGKGAWGTVYPGKSLKTGDNIAAKKVTVETEFIDAEVYKEADMLMKKLPPHEYVVRVHDFIRVDIVKNSIPHANFWLMMDFCESGNLKTYARNNELDTDEKLEVMLFCSRGLQHLHDNRIVHRDLKPENILIGSSHKEVKLSDFGTARTVDLLHGKSVTLNSLAGTLDYMAPELYSLLVDGVEPSYDKSVDLFSLGLCFLALLEAVKGSAMKPYTVNGQSLGRVMWQNRKGLFVAADIYKPDDPTGFVGIKKLITKMIRQTPAERWTAHEVWNRIMCMFEGLGDEVDEMLEDTSKW